MIRFARPFAVLAFVLPAVASATDPGQCPITAPAAARIVTGWTTATDAPTQGRSQDVVVHATINASGKAEDLQLADAALPASAMQSVRNAVSLWEFQPATRCGAPISERVALIVPMRVYSTPNDRPFFARRATDAPAQPRVHVR